MGLELDMDILSSSSFQHIPATGTRGSPWGLLHFGMKQIGCGNRLLDVPLGSY
jgi:hypothetical protein